jgi:iron complex transport system ATP-binding protein
MAAAATDVNALELRAAGVPGRLTAVSLTLRRGELVGLLGPNGSGKSTLLQAAAGLLPLEPGGAVRIDGRELREIPILERGRRIAWVPQEAQFEFGFSVRSVVAQARFAHGEDGRAVEEAIRRMDLTPLEDRPVNRLSGGERQRVLLARAVATQAPLQLWDEPLAALDPKHALETLVLARELTQAGATVLLSLHDLRAAYCLDRVVVLGGGRLRAFGPPEEVLTTALLRDVFGVEVRIAPTQVFTLPRPPHT